MNSIFLKYIYTGLFFLVIFASGFWLSRAGKPYATLLLNLHKLTALGAFIFLAVTAFRIFKITPPGPRILVVVGLSAACFISLIVTGGLLSALKVPPSWLGLAHKILPYAALFFSAAGLYFLLGASAAN